MSRILVVEDQTNVRRAMALLLNRDGHTVLEAANVAAALRIAADAGIDVVLTDVRIEGDGGGVELLKALKSRDADVEVVLITAFGTISDEAGRSGPAAADGAARRRAQRARA
jgi:DNA-binding NtrC family response regulator